MALRYRVAKKVEISASHQLDGLPPSHKCHNLHGHNYSIEVELTCRVLDEQGMVVDYDKLSQVIKMFDHKHLNDFFSPATAEKFAEVLWDAIEHTALSSLNKGLADKDAVRLEAVRIQETGNNLACLERE